VIAYTVSRKCASKANESACGCSELRVESFGLRVPEMLIQTVRVLYKGSERACRERKINFHGITVKVCFL
jgi:hypothetical protein